VGPRASLDILEKRIIPSPWYSLDRRLNGPTAGSNTLKTKISAFFALSASSPSGHYANQATQFPQAPETKGISFGNVEILIRKWQ
jgi:hypothetical protein